MNRRSAIRAAIGGIVAAVMPWKAKPVQMMFCRTESIMAWEPCGPWYQAGDSWMRDFKCTATGNYRTEEIC